MDDATLEQTSLAEISEHLERVYGMKPVATSWLDQVSDGCKDRGGCRAAGLSEFRRRVRDARCAGC